MELIETHDGPALTREQFQERIRLWVNGTRGPKCPTSCKLKQNDWRRSNQFFYRLKCKSCDRCKWSGSAKYCTRTNTLILRGDALDKHGNKERKHGGSGLSQVQKDIIRHHVLENKVQVLRLQQIMEAWMGPRRCLHSAVTTLVP